MFSSVLNPFCPNSFTVSIRWPAPAYVNKSDAYRPTATYEVWLRSISADLFSLVTSCAVLRKTTPSFTKSKLLCNRSLFANVPYKLSRVNTC